MHLTVRPPSVASQLLTWHLSLLLHCLQLALTAPSATVHMQLHTMMLMNATTGIRKCLVCYATFAVILYPEYNAGDSSPCFAVEP